MSTTIYNFPIVICIGYGPRPMGYADRYFHILL